VSVNKGIIGLVIALILSGLSFYAGGWWRQKNLQVAYISQKEILELEKIRIEKEPSGKKQLFFGNPEKAIEYIEAIEKQMQKSGTLVLLVDSKIYGSNVRSASTEVHKKITEELSGSRDK
jgi:hypothetical protein